MNLVMTASPPCFGSVAANALGVAVVADTVPVLVCKGTVLFTVISVISALVANSVAVLVAVGAVLFTVVNNFCFGTAVMSAAVMSVCGNGKSRHGNRQSKYCQN